MIDERKLQQLAAAASMIVGGYAFTIMSDGNIQVLALHGENHVCIIRNNGEVLETNMDDIELAIANKYWQRNKKMLKEEFPHA